MKSIYIINSHGFLAFVMAVFLQYFALSVEAADLSLDECLKTGLAGSPDIKAASCRLSAAKAGVKSAESAYYPWVTASTLLARTDNPPQAFMMSLNQRILDMRDPAFDPNNPDTTDNLRAGIGVQYRVLDGGRSRLDRGMAKLGAAAAAENLETVRNELAHQITRAYYGVMKTKTFINVQEEAVKSAEENLRVATERSKAGAALETDVLNLDVQLAQGREDLIRAKNGLLMAIAALNTAIGRDLATPENISAGHVDLPALPVSHVAMSDAERRPEYKAMSLVSEIREKSLQKARREYAPTISVFASSDRDSNVSTDFKQSYMVGVTAEINIFDGFRARSAVNEADAQAKASAADREKALNNLKLDLTQAGIELKEARERIEVTGKGAESAVQALKVTRERYKNGACGVSDLITAQGGSTAMKARDTAARYDYLVAISNLSRAKGELASKYDEGT